MRGDFKGSVQSVAIRTDAARGSLVTGEVRPFSPTACSFWVKLHSQGKVNCKLVLVIRYLGSIAAQELPMQVAFLAVASSCILCFGT